MVPPLRSVEPEVRLRAGARRADQPEVTTADTNHLSDVLDGFVNGTVAVEDALLVSADGVGLAVSDGLPSAVADQFGAIAAGLVSLTSGAARCFAEDRAQRAVIELDRSYLLVSSINDRAVLGVVARKDADVGLVAYEMSLVAERLAPELTAARVAGLQNTLSV